MAGQFSGTVIFDGVGGSDSQTDLGGNSDSFVTKYNANGSYGWTRTFDTYSGYAEAEGVATDSSGNVYVTGYFSGTVIFDGVGGSDSQTSTAGSAFLTKYSANGNYDYTKIFDTSAGGSNAQGMGVATDNQGHVYITGNFNGTVVFDGVGGSDSQASPGGEDSFLTKYNDNGTYDYTKIFDTTNGNASAIDISIDTSGNVYIVGNFGDTVVFDGIGGSDSQTSSSGSDFLTKYNANGSYGYTKIFDTSSPGAYAEDQGVATDGSGNVYVTGYFSGTVVFDGIGGSDSETSSVNTDNYLTKYNSNGTYGWTKSFDASASNSSAFGRGVATDSLGDVYVLSGFYGTVVFDGTGGSDSQTTTNPDGAITKYNANGSYGWTKTFDASNGDAVLTEGLIGGITTDSLGNVYATGYFTGTVVFDGIGGSDSQTDPGQNFDAFLTSYDAFIPSTPVAAITPKAPNTGFGEMPLSNTEPYGLLAMTSFIILSLCIYRIKLTK
jgi:hypothetical protein